MDGPSVPRSFAITRRDLVDYGYTLSCPGCYAAANDKKHKPHTAVCRDRIAKALSEDESQAHRVADARDREDAFLENAIREGDIHKNNVTGEEEKNDENMSIPLTPTGPAIATPAGPSVDATPREQFSEVPVHMSHEDAP